MVGSQKRALLVVVFAPAAILARVVMALEDSIIASIVPESQHGMAHGTLAVSNAVWDLICSVLVRDPWTARLRKPHLQRQESHSPRPTN